MKLRRAEIYEKIQKQIIDDMVVYPIAYPNSIVAVRSNLGELKKQSQFQSLCLEIYLNYI